MLRDRIISVLTPLLMLLVLSIDLNAQDIPPMPFPARTVNDYANILEIEQAVDLEHKLCAYWDSTDVQLVVVIVPTLGGYESSEYAVKLHREWGVGNVNTNKGIVILVKPKTEQELGDVFISVGYGLEGDIPDVYADRIIERVMIPQFINEDYYSGIDLACDALMRLAAGESISAVEDTTTDKISYILFWVVMIGLPILIIVFILQIFGVIKTSGGGGYSGGSSGSTYRSSGSYRSYGGGSAGGGGAGRRW